MNDHSAQRQPRIPDNLPGEALPQRKSLFGNATPVEALSAGHGEGARCAEIEALREIAVKAAAYRQGRDLSRSDASRAIVQPVLGVLGWDLHDLDAVRGDFPPESPVDFALFTDASPRLLVETVAPCDSLDERSSRILNAATIAKAPWCVLTNGEEWRLYKTLTSGDAKKQFLTAFLNESSIETAVSTLSLLSRDRMNAGAMDAFWQKLSTDRQIEEILGGISEDESFIRLVTKLSSGLGKDAVRATLRRVKLSIAPPEAQDLPELARKTSEKRGTKPEAGGENSRPTRAARMRTRDLFQNGLLPKGTVLTIPGFPQHPATVVDGKYVEFQGEPVTFNDWVHLVKGVSSNNIFRNALLPDGRSLEALREGAASLPFARGSIPR